MKKAFIADFGAGNTCLYSTVLDAAINHPQPLNDPNGEPSGYALGSNGEIMLGMSLMGFEYEDMKDICKFRINLKAKPTAENAQELTFYFKSWLDKIKEEHASEFVGVTEAYWFIGFPTGKEWKTQQTREIYQKIFEDAGFENVTLVPESNAALAYYQKTKGVLDGYDNKNTILLLLDQGAYSLDATCYADNTISSMGSYLGASLIERMMVHVVLYEPEEENRQDKNIHNMPDVLAEARTLYESDDKFRTFLLLCGRALKEDYFTQERKHMLSKSWDVLCLVRFRSKNGNPLSLFVNQKVIHKILFEEPVRDVLGNEFNALAPEVKAELGNKTWMQAFASFLQELREHHLYLNDPSKELRVMMTGGGSRMKCLSEMVREQYGSAILYEDPEAITAIGMGMAYWAPDKVKAKSFEEAFMSFANSKGTDEDGDSVNMIMHRVNSRIILCIRDMIHQCTQEEIAALTDSIKKWREYNCSSSDIPNEIKTHFTNWKTNTGTPSFLKAIDETIADLKRQLNKEFSIVLKERGMHDQTLLEENNKVFLSITKELLKYVFDCTIEYVGDYYKKHEIWSAFPNRKKGFISDPRGEFVSSLAEGLSEWIKKEVDGTIDLYIKIFTELEIDYMGEKRVFLTCFTTEALFDLLSLMESRKKEILGKLVLEEYLED